VFPLTWIWSSIVHHLSGPKRYALRLRIKTPACSASLTRFLLKKVTFIVHLNVGSDTSIQFGLLGPCFKTGAARLSVCVFCCWERDSITYSANQLGSEASRPKSIVLVSPNLGQATNEFATAKTLLFNQKKLLLPAPRAFLRTSFNFVLTWKFENLRVIQEAHNLQLLHLFQSGDKR